MSFLEQREPMNREHAAWMDLCRELRTAHAEIDWEDYRAPAVCAIRKWGEELSMLRLSQRAEDPTGPARALRDARDGYAGQYERGTYPEEGAGG